MSHLIARRVRFVALLVLVGLAAPAGAQSTPFDADAFLSGFYNAVAAGQPLQPFFIATPEFGLNAPKVVVAAQTITLLLQATSVYFEGDRTRYVVRAQDIQTSPRGVGYALTYRERWTYGDTKNRRRAFHEVRAVTASVVPFGNGWAFDSYVAENVADVDASPALVHSSTIELTGRGFGPGIQTRDKVAASAVAVFFLIGLDHLSGGHWITVTSEPAGLSLPRRFFLWEDAATNDGKRINRAPLRGQETAANRGGVFVFLWGPLTQALKPAEYKVAITVDGTVIGTGKVVVIP